MSGGPITGTSTPRSCPSAPCRDLGGQSLRGRLRLRRTHLPEVMQPEHRLAACHHPAPLPLVTLSHPLQVLTCSWLGSPFSYLTSIHLTARRAPRIGKCHILRVRDEGCFLSKELMPRVPTFVVPTFSWFWGWGLVQRHLAYLLPKITPHRLPL